MVIKAYWISLLLIKKIIIKTKIITINNNKNNKKITKQVKYKMLTQYIVTRTLYISNSPKKYYTCSEKYVKHNHYN